MINVPVWRLPDNNLLPDELKDANVILYKDYLKLEAQKKKIQERNSELINKNRDIDTEWDDYKIRQKSNWDWLEKQIEEAESKESFGDCCEVSYESIKNLIKEAQKNDRY